VTGYGVGGLILDVPAKSLPALVEWALSEAQLGAERLHGSGRDADPLLVLTRAACERYGLPAALPETEQKAGRLSEGHKVIKQVERAGWKLTKRGLGPWARIYRPAEGGRRSCVQLCIPSWHALGDRSWGHAARLEPAELARVLGVYAARVMTPVGSTAVTGLELMTALNPPTRASKPDEDGHRHSEPRPGSLGTEPIDPAPCEAPDGHPVLAHLPRFHMRGPEERLFEEAYDWARDLTDDECMQRYLVGLDVNLAFGAAANGAVVGLASPPVHVTNPVFDPAVPGSWLVDLSHVDLSRVKVGKSRWRRPEPSFIRVRAVARRWRGWRRVGASAAVSVLCAGVAGLGRRRVARAASTEDGLYFLRRRSSVRLAIGARSASGSPWARWRTTTTPIASSTRSRISTSCWRRSVLGVAAL
jgi:hypothetical protein